MEVSFMATAFASQISPCEIGNSDSYNELQTQRLTTLRYKKTSPPIQTPIAKSLRVLVIDDHRDGNRILNKLINLWGHHCRPAYNGASGLGVAAEFRPEVVILDILMPQMDGIELTSLLRQQAGFSKTLIIAVTGCTNTLLSVQSEQAGIDLYLIKPIGPNLLKNVLQSEAAYLATAERTTLRRLSTLAWLPLSSSPHYRDTSATPNHESLVALAT
jgi:CheY-like chemotaxis protein